jgi:hypothetical protein
MLILCLIRLLMLIYSRNLKQILFPCEESSVTIRIMLNWGQTPSTSTFVLAHDVGNVLRVARHHLLHVMSVLVYPLVAAFAERGGSFEANEG